MKKDVEIVQNANFVCLMYKLIKSCKDSDNMSIGFLRVIDTGERELSISKGTKRNYHVGTYLKDVFGFAEHQESATYGLGFELTPEAIVIVLY